MMLLPIAKPDDPRVVCCSRCTWWDGIDQAKLTRPLAGGLQLTVCPFCGGLVHAFEDEAAWYRVAAFSLETGYLVFVKWLRGQSFETYDVAREAFSRANRQSGEAA